MRLSATRAGQTSAHAAGQRRGRSGLGGSLAAVMDVTVGVEDEPVAALDRGCRSGRAPRPISCMLLEVCGRTREQYATCLRQTREHALSGL